MRNLTAGTLAHLSEPLTFWATCWKVSRSDGTDLGFTDHDLDIVFGGLTYLAASGINPHAIDVSDAFFVDNTEIGGVLSSAAIKETDILAGMYDASEVTVYMVNYQDPTESIILFKGRVGEIRSVGSSETFFAELRSLSTYLQRPSGRLIQGTCDADLGDSRCGVNLASLTISGAVVASVISQRQFTTTDASVIAEANGYFSGGVVTFETGQNASKGKVSQMEVKAFSVAAGVATITLHLPMSFTISASDEFSIHPGCDKTLSVCASKFSNTVNFRGFPYVPGSDKAIQYVQGR